MQRIGPYEIHGVLGQGAMGVVYRAVDPIIGRTLALKTIRISTDLDAGERETLRARLLREAKSAGSLSHPGIVTIYQVADDGDLSWIAMEFVDGSMLDEYVAAHPGREGVLGLLRQAAAGLDYAHSKGIVHRDVKPANILVTHAGDVKITDFGVAKLLEGHSTTQAGMVVGTPYYMSPEQILGAALDGRCDQFSLAVMAYNLLTGEKPFLADTITGLMYKIVHEEPAPAHQINPSLPFPFDAALRRALSKDPANRFPTCAEFVAALEGREQPSLRDQPTQLMKSPALAERTDPAVLERLQTWLAPVVGPIARHLVKNAAGRQLPLRELCDELATHIPDAKDRARFLERCRAELEFDREPAREPALVAPVASSPRPVVWDPALLERARKELAAHIGPMAKFIVDRSAKKASTLEEFYGALGAEIPSTKDRERFLSALNGR